MDSHSPAESPLPPAILRSLGDRSYDKRKNAALEIEALIKALEENNDTDRICSVIAMLGQDFATSTNANHRKGGLIGLAATSIGLMQDVHAYLDALLPPVLHCFDDPEARVRYYSCESLYNIAKVARSHILKYFNQIFDGLCKLFADVDVDVKNGANLLDRLIRDIVTESESFDVERFIPLLQKYIRRTNPYIRQLLVGWITVLDSVPDINMLDWLPDFLDGLFNMLSDSNREIRQAADSALAEFLLETKQSAVVEFGPMVAILVGQCNSKERFNRLTAINWVQEFINLGGDRLLLFYSEILGAIMHCISDADQEIRVVSDNYKR
jgi:vacuole morphology and inheritance protein 14